jgi:hypothetical protein
VPALFLAVLMLVAPIAVLAADKTTSASRPELRTNQQFIEELNLTGEPGFDVNDLKAVFRFIFSSLPDEIRVYPTENYYYFNFYHQGIKYAGNLRLAAVDRDKGILHFAYFADANASSSEGSMHYLGLSDKDGVLVEKAGPLEYKVGFGDRLITFHLNDVSDVKPPKESMLPEEIYLGPVFDESGLQFYLLFNSDLKIFHYILNETGGTGDQLIASEVSKRILIGKRSGFAFYKDHHVKRKVLIAVHAANVVVNNYYDGPFDQLPDNFIKGDALKDAIEASDPAMVGQIDRFGYLASGEGRYLIGPYIQYSDPGDLAVFDECASNPAMSRKDYPSCFAMQGGGK